MIRTLLVLLLVTGTAAADITTDRAAAEALFKDAKQLTRDGKYADACPKFEASLKLDYAVGTLLNLADCFDQIGRTASAWARFSEAAELLKAERDDRLAYAQQRIAKLEPRLAWLTIRVTEAARVPGLKVTRNNVTVLDAVFDTRVPVDPGQVVVTAAADGYKPVTKTVTLPPAGGSEVVEITGLEKLPPPIVEEPPVEPTPVAPPPQDNGRPPLVVTEQPAVPATPIAPVPPRPEGSTLTGVQTLGLIVTVAGGAAIGGSLVLGYQAKSRWDQSKDLCNGMFCNVQGKNLADSAKSRARVATISFAAGAAALIGGIVIYKVAPKPQAKERTAVVPRVGPDGAGVLVTGSF